MATSAQEVWNGRAVTAFLFSIAVSVLGSAVGAVAVPWLLLSVHLDLGSVALVLGLQSLAAVSAALLGSAVVDRFDRRLLCVFSNLLLALVLAIVVVAYGAGRLNTVLLGVAVAVNAVLAQILGGAESSMIPDLAQSRTRIAGINGAIGLFHNGGDVLGPLIGGLLVSALGIAWALGIDGSTFLIAALVFMLLIPARTGRVLASESGRESILSGLTLLLRQPVLRAVTLASAFVNLACTPLLIFTVPVLSKTSGHTAFEAGLLMACFGFGALATSVAFTYARPASASPLSLICSSGIAVACCLGMAALGIAWAPIFFTLVGACVGYLGPLEQTIVQRAAPPDAVGRVVLAYSAARTVLVPCGFIAVSAAFVRGGFAASLIVTAWMFAAATFVLGYSAVRERAAWRIA